MGLVVAAAFGELDLAEASILLVADVGISEGVGELLHVVEAAEVLQLYLVLNALQRLTLFSYSLTTRAQLHLWETSRIPSNFVFR